MSGGGGDGGCGRRRGGWWEEKRGGAVEFSSKGGIQEKEEVNLKQHLLPASTFFAVHVHVYAEVAFVDISYSHIVSLYACIPGTSAFRLTTLCNKNAHRNPSWLRHVVKTPGGASLSLLIALHVLITSVEGRPSVQLVAVRPVSGAAVLMKTQRHSTTSDTFSPKRWPRVSFTYVVQYVYTLCVSYAVLALYLVKDI